jgi:dTDP-4-dehydrorhamnose reductase
MKDRVLVVGADGLVGGALFQAFRETGQALGTSRRPQSGHITLDLAGDGANAPLPGDIAIAFLCAAVTSLQKCRENPAASGRVNVTNTVALAERLVSGGARVVFFSTGLVFDGSRPFCRESDAPHPQCEYGRQKAAAERALLVLGDAVAVVRLTKVVAPGIPLFRRWREDLSAGRVIRPFTDYKMSPITVNFVVAAMRALSQNWLPGLLHLSADRELAYQEAAVQLATSMDPTRSLLSWFEPTTSRAAGVDLETNPQFTTLDTTRLRSELNLPTPSADAALAECFQPPSA